MLANTVGVSAKKKEE